MAQTIVIQLDVPYALTGVGNTASERSFTWEQKQPKVHSNLSFSRSPIDV